MTKRYTPTGVVLVLLGVAVASPRLAQGFVIPAGTTADSARFGVNAAGDVGPAGTPIRLTWSIVPDGTRATNISANNVAQPSNLVATLDATFGAGPGGSDYRLRPWFPYFDQAFERWESLTGVTYTYEPADSGGRHGSSFTGVTGVQGDVRIAGLALDGPGGTLAYNYLPPDGSDMCLDTGDMATFYNPANNFRAFRNVIMHEAGHGLGIEHTTSSDADFLMEPALATNFDGPQHDDLRGMHWLYGDALEKSFGGLGNGVAARASSLGTLSPGGALAVGTAGSGTVVGPTETDFVSIASSADVDFFSFSVTQPTTVNATMTPRGGSYLQNSTVFDTTATSDLGFALIGSNGSTLLADATSSPAGQAESIVSFSLPTAGQYYLRVSGAGTVVQFYSLAITAAAATLPGDYNRDGFVNVGDYTLWRDTLGSSIAPFSGADGNGDGSVSPADYSLWVASYGASAATTIPEPALLAATGVIMLGASDARVRRRSLPRGPVSPWPACKS